MRNRDEWSLDREAAKRASILFLRDLHRYGEHPPKSLDIPEGNPVRICPEYALGSGSGSPAAMCAEIGRI